MPHCPRDIIYALHNPMTDALMTRSSDMANIVQTYHDNLQKMNILPTDDPTHQAVEEEVLTHIPESQKFNSPESKLHSMLNQTHVAEVLKTSKNGTATGLDGLPYELWKALHA